METMQVGTGRGTMLKDPHSLPASCTGNVGCWVAVCLTLWVEVCIWCEFGLRRCFFGVLLVWYRSDTDADKLVS